MSADDIPLHKAELLSVWLEALLYGFSLLMFGATIWTLVFKRHTRQADRRMLIVACLLLLGSTMHVIIDIIRIMQGLISYRNTYPGGPVAYFSDVSQWTFVAKNYVFTGQTLIGDGVLIYRCYVVWQSKLVIVLPVLLWCATAATGIGSPYTGSRVTQSGVWGGSPSQWITGFWATALATNLLTALLLVCRIWYVDRRSMRLRIHQPSQRQPIRYILIDAGVIYSLTLLVALVCFVSRSNSLYVLLGMVTPIISITFYMVIIRVGLTARVNHSTRTLLNKSSMDDTLGAEPSRGTQVRVTQLIESKVDGGQSSPRYQASPNTSSEMKSEGPGDIEGM